MKFSISQSLKDIPAAEWNALVHDNNPFVQHDFLYALETGNCLQPYGWHPRYLLIHNDEDHLIGAAPAYIKTNSYGEFVFDWAWADAYQRAQIEYYPKLVIAAPFSPCTGPRLLTQNKNEETAQALIALAMELAKQEKLSSIHWLFNQDWDFAQQQKHNFLTRFDYQFHWHNQSYTDFDDFLSRLSMKKRKNIKRERKKVFEAGIKISCLNGEDLDEQQWSELYNFYTITFMKKSGHATLTLDFFKAIQHKLLAIFAYDNERPVAGAICIKGDNALYGRHWGCYENYDSLHFETCYYTGIEYCIAHNINCFEPGAQGEHKISRGFLPVKTVSSHWLDERGFNQAIKDHVQRESRAMQEYGEELAAASPYKKI